MKLDNSVDPLPSSKSVPPKAPYLDPTIPSKKKTSWFARLKKFFGF